MRCCWDVRNMSVRGRAMMDRVDGARCWWMLSVIVGRWRSRFLAQTEGGRRRAVCRERMAVWKAGQALSSVEISASELMTVASTSVRSVAMHRQLLHHIAHSLRMLSTIALAERQHFRTSAARERPVKIRYLTATRSAQNSCLVGTSAR